VNEKSYDKISERWHEFRSNKHINPLVIEFAHLVKKEGLILDVGCGTGIPITEFLVNEGFRVVGLDISKNMVKKAQSMKISNTKFYVGNIMTWHDNNTYDGIIAYDSLFHLPLENQKNVYRILSSLLTKDGYLFFTHGKELGEVKSKMFDEEFYYSAIDLEMLKKTLEDNSLEIIRLITDYQDEFDSRDLIVIVQKK